jgi:hypothetical protein
MTRDEALQSISLKKRFCKDYNIPIAVYDNPYFMQRLNIINIVKPCVEAFEIFCKELESYNCEQDYFEYYNQVKDNIITDIKENVEFNAFSYNQYTVNSQYPRKNVYVEDNNGLVFMSLDMKKANFSALHYWSSSIFNYCDTWEEFVSSYTNSKHIINSKYIRQVVMGACNPKKQIQYERYLMSELLDTIIPHIAGKFEVFSLGEDEIILQPKIRISSDGDIDMLYDCVKNALEFSDVKKYIRLTMFRLERIYNTDGWIKHMINDSELVEFKCLSAEIYHQIVKYYFCEQIEDDDLVFYHNGCLARFLEPIPNPWN